MSTEAVAAVAAVLLASVHLGAGALRFLDVVPRSRWLSIAGGISVAYVFVHLLPELEEAQHAIGSAAGFLPYLERHAYLMALLGLATFYGLERVSRRSRQGRRTREGTDETDADVASLAIAFYTAYNALIGYLLVHREDGGALELALFAFAMGVHFIVNDHGLRQDHRNFYHRWGRWMVAGAVLLGWVVGLATELAEPAIALLLAFLVGGVILNVLKEELPEERDSRFSAFASGALGYSILLLVVQAVA